MTGQEIKDTIVKIVKTYYGIDAYGILNVLIRDYGYDYLKDNGFEKYLSESCKVNNISIENGKYYLPADYLLPARLESALEVDCCKNCQFRIRAGDLPENLKNKLNVTSSQLWLCSLNLTIKLNTNALERAQPNCPRNQLHNKIHKSEMNESKKEDDSTKENLESGDLLGEFYNMHPEIFTPVNKFMTFYNGLLDTLMPDIYGSYTNNKINFPGLKEEE